MKAYKTILKTELKLSLRGLDMLIFAIIMPIIVLIILGIFMETSLLLMELPIHLFSNLSEP